MRQLFNTEQWNRGKVTPPLATQVYRQLDIEINRVKDRIDASRFRVDNSHLLLNLLLTINANPERDTLSFLDRVIAQEVSVAGKFGLATETKSAKLLHGVFFNSQADEIIYLSDDYVDLDWAIANWKKLTPVRVQQHPFTDLSFDINDGDYTNVMNEGLCVTSVNLQLLAIQFQQWYKHERLLPNGSSRLVHEFIYQYPLKNMLRRTVSLTMQNRLFNIAAGSHLDNVDFIKIGIAATNDHTANVDRFLNELHQRLTKNKYNFLDICHHMPALPMVNTLKLPNTIYSTKLNWVNTFARLNLLAYLFRFYIPNGGNQKWSEMLKREVKLILNNSGMPSDFPYQYVQQLEAFLKY